MPYDLNEPMIQSEEIFEDSNMENGSGALSPSVIVQIAFQENSAQKL
jgi:hypothetical protein